MSDNITFGPRGPVRTVPTAPPAYGAEAKPRSAPTGTDRRDVVSVTGGRYAQPPASAEQVLGQRKSWDSLWSVIHAQMAVYFADRMPE